MAKSLDQQIRDAELVLYKLVEAKIKAAATTEERKDWKEARGCIDGIGEIADTWAEEDDD